MFSHQCFRSILVLIAACFMAVATLHAKPYGEYDVRQIIKKNESGQGGSIDLTYVDVILGDLRAKAESYPVQFDSESDQNRARRDTGMLMGMLSIIGKEPNAPFEICLRLGMLGQIGYNLQMPGMDEAAQFYFSKALSQQPKNAFANYQFGLYLVQSNRALQAVSYLETAKSTGHAPALFTLGLVHLSLKDSAKALEYLNAYRERVPSDTNAVQIIEAIKLGTITIHKQEKP